jgi:hypothetical protein
MSKVICNLLVSLFITNAMTASNGEAKIELVPTDSLERTVLALEWRPGSWREGVYGRTSISIPEGKDKFRVVELDCLRWHGEAPFGDCLQWINKKIPTKWHRVPSTTTRYTISAVPVWFPRRGIKDKLVLTPQNGSDE